MKLKRWRGVLVVCLVVGAVVVGGAMATMTGFSDANAEDGASGDVPRIYISLNDTTLEEINAGGKDVKYGGNSLTLWDGDAESYFENVEIKGRGNSTWKVDKKPYQIKFKQKVDFLGMGKERKWVLLANYLDHSSLRTDLSFYLARMVNENYVIDGRFAEVYVDNEYVGLYYVTKAMGIDKNVVDLRDPMGILVEVDNVFYDGEDYWYETAGGNYLTVKDVVAEDNFEAAMKDFAKDFEALEKTAKARDFKKASEIVDMDSLAEYYVLSELTGNLDAYITSFYFYKDGADDKIHAGPGWDFDATFGNTNWHHVVDDGKIFAAETIEARREQAFNSEHPESAWVSRIVYYLSETEEFHEATCKVFEQKLFLNKNETIKYVQDVAATIRREAIMNNEKWGLDDFDASVESLITWLLKRYDVLHDSCLPKIEMKEV